MALPEVVSSAEWLSADSVPLAPGALRVASGLGSRRDRAGAALVRGHRGADRHLPGGWSLNRDLRTRAVALAEGNPLFAEQFVALLAADGVEVLPSTAPTIHAILAACLDRRPGRACGRRAGGCRRA